VIFSNCSAEKSAEKINDFDVKFCCAYVCTYKNINFGFSRNQKLLGRKYVTIAENSDIDLKMHRNVFLS
jgi:hypothetical protein